MKKIIQLSDLHIGEEEEDTFSIDVRANFLKALGNIRALDPDRLVLTGDLCFRDGDPAIYQWIKSHIDGLPFPVDLISGNHDDTVLLGRRSNDRDSTEGIQKNIRSSSS